MSVIIVQKTKHEIQNEIYIFVGLNNVEIGVIQMSGHSSLLFLFKFFK